MTVDPEAQIAPSDSKPSAGGAEGLPMHGLSIVGVTKHYPGTQALRLAPAETLTFAHGSIHGLAGLNGAGKSTLVAIIAGIQRPTSGRMWLDGVPYAPRNTEHARDRGIDIVLQEPALIDSMTVEENLVLGRERSFAPFGVFNPQKRRRLAQAALDRLPVKPPLTTLAGKLTLEEQKLVELARALSLNPKILIMDEVTASMSARGAENIRQVLRQFAAEGKLIIYISHHLDEIFQSCDLVTVIKDGRPVGTIRPADTDRPRLEMMMVGSAVANARDRPPVADGEPVLELNDVEVRGQFQHVSLAVRRGQVLGVAGLMDSGAGALAMTLFGAQRPRAGTMRLEGSPIRFRGPHHAVSSGVGFIPSDRDRDGVILGISIQKNIALAALPWIATRGFLNPRRERRLSDGLVDRLKIKCHDSGDLPMRLSGGNRQKVAFAKWLARQPKVLVLHNPTRGVDVEGYADIHRHIMECAEQGVGIVLVSDNLSELLELSDQMITMRRGQISGTFARSQRPSERQLVDLML